MLLQDPETGQMCEVASGIALQKVMLKRSEEQTTLLKKVGVDLLDLSINQPIAHPIAQFFHKRIGKQI
jgi:hypothetical protein